MTEKEQDELNQKLIAASYNGNLKKVKSLIKKGADIHANDNQALVSASRYGFLEIVKYLIEQGADVHAQDNDALSWASIYGYLDIVKYLVENGADVFSQTNNALIYASFRDCLEVIKYFILDCNADIQTTLDQAKKHQNIAIVNWCERYIESKKLNEQLENDLYANTDKIKKKVKI